MFINSGVTLGSGLRVGDLAINDPYFNQVSLLLPGTGSNNATNNTFIDSSTNNFTITQTGEVAPGSFNPYDTLWSNYFDGTGDYLSVAHNTNLNLVDSDFTIEAWIYMSKYNTGNMQVINKDGSSTQYPSYAISISSTGQLNALIANSSGTSIIQLLTSTATMAVGTWHHVAFTRSGTALRSFINGVQAQTATQSITMVDGSRAIGIGWQNGYVNGDTFYGYISNVRILKGTALYTGNFTPPTAPLTAITNTQLLTCQSNRLIDNSTNNFTLTKNGDVKVLSFSPFSPSSNYVSSSGASALFDGDVDFLSLAGSAQFAIATSTTPFTIEGYVYPTAAGSVIFSEQFTGTGNSIPIVLSLSNGTDVSTPTGLQPGLGYYTGSAWVSAAISSISIPLFAWSHIAAVFTGSTTKIYVNGSDVTKPSSPTPATTWGVTGVNGDLWYVGRRWDVTSNVYFSGYISGFRFVNGTAVYTANFTPPSSPLTAISNTSLLLNFAEANIIDYSADNNFATVGNAKLSTVQSKYGTGSISLDGTNSYLQSFWLPSQYQFGTEDFTIEMWVYLTSTPSGGALISEIYNSPSDTNVAWTIAFGTTIGATSGSTIYFGQFSSSAWTGVLGSSSITLNTWTHVAVCRVSGTVTIYLNGTSVGSGAVTTTAAGSKMFIGKRWDAAGTSNFIAGYINDLRITNGIARYTTNFTPPSLPLPLY